MERENLGSRLGFLLLSAGCAIGLGNIWRFPYICGQYGGALFLLFYLLFLALIGFPVLTMELALGRAGRKVLPGCLASLSRSEKFARVWKFLGHIAFLGNWVLLMFYTVVTGWLLRYTVAFAKGNFQNLSTEKIGEAFDGMLQSPVEMTLYMVLAIVIAGVICFSGLKNGVERTTKFMMLGLFLLLIWLVIRSAMLPGGWAGIQFMVCPNVARMKENGIFPAMHAALMQAFFTLSLGVGSMTVFGSYTSRDHSLAKESIFIIILDTFVALCAGFIIFPACFSSGVEPNQGPGLIFMTMPQVFSSMRWGGFWGTLFFLFLSIAALTTLVSVTENLVAYGMECFRWERKRSAIVISILLVLLSMPCVLGFNLWAGFQPFGEGSNVLDLEDFLVSDNLLPLGSLMMVLFCAMSSGWGQSNFLEETNSGKGLRFPRFAYGYVKYVLPCILFGIWLTGIILRFRKG